MPQNKFKIIEQKKKDIDDFIHFLEENQFDSTNVESFMRSFILLNYLKKLLGYFLVILALAIIILPLPHSLEVATLYYFNPDDGITISDIIALFILLSGIILIVNKNWQNKPYLRSSRKQDEYI